MLSNMSFNRFHHRQLPKGLTLLELVVTVALFAVVSLAITKLYLQVLSAQDRILDEQNIIADLNYATTVFVDEARRSVLQTEPAGACGDTLGINCANKFFCSSSVADRVCLMGRDYARINYYTAAGLFQALRGGSTYGITSSDINFSVASFRANTVGNQIDIKIEASGDNQYQQKVFYQNYLTK
jgi:prepilin-type N-terminal cleavage/methylation domain-containing protein